MCVWSDRAYLVSYSFHVQATSQSPTTHMTSSLGHSITAPWSTRQLSLSLNRQLTDRRSRLRHLPPRLPRWLRALMMCVILFSKLSRWLRVQSLLVIYLYVFISFFFKLSKPWCWNTSKKDIKLALRFWRRSIKFTNVHQLSETTACKTPAPSLKRCLSSQGFLDNISCLNWASSPTIPSSM